MFDVLGIDTPLIVNENADGSLTFKRQSVDVLVEQALTNPRTAISNRETGRYAVASPRGFESSTDMPKAEIVLIRPTPTKSIIEIVPICSDIPKIGMEADDTIDALDTVCELYPSIEMLPSIVLSEISN